MKNLLCLQLLVLLLAVNFSAAAQTVSRGPYLQMVNQSAATIRWRTDVPTDSKINYGTVAGSLTYAVTSPDSTLEHELRITGLAAGTKYFYSIGTTTVTLDAAPINWFITAPPANSNNKVRIAAFGDCGVPSANQTNVRDKYLQYIGSNPTDVWILMGDNAYNYGYDVEYQTGFFDPYKNTLLPNHPLFPSPGNHDYRNDQGFASDRTTVDYYKNFTMPKNGECGGVPSNTEAYYSFDWGPVHFLSLDSYGKEDANTTRLYDTLGAQVTWIKQDLAANTKKWVIAYFHHPPFTVGGHFSDFEDELIQIREKFIRILERYGVDLVLCGHSHAYERSYLLKGYYSGNGSFNKALHTADSSSGKYDGSANSCLYHYDNGKYLHGTAYVVAGSAGQSNSLPFRLNALPFGYGNGSNGGSLYLEADSTRLDAKMIGYDGLIKDQFTIMKDINKKTEITITQGSQTNLAASWPGNYSWSNGASTRSITVTPETSTVFTVSDQQNCIKDTFNIAVIASGICINRTLGSGSWSNPAIWDKGVAPSACDSVVISAGHQVTADLNAHISGLYVAAGAVLSIGSNGVQLESGAAGGGKSNVVIDGTLNITNGRIAVNGRVLLNSSSNFNMSAGSLVIDGNNGTASGSVPDGLALFQASAGLGSFQFTGGELLITDPPFGSNSQSIHCAYNFGDGSTLQMGDGISTTAGNNANGFGGNLMPAVIGHFILDAVVKTNNRHFIDTAPISMKSPVQVKSGNLVQSALLNIRQ